MVSRRSIKLPIALAVVMAVLLGVLAAGWVLLALFGALGNERFAELNWTLFGVGSGFIGLLLAGVVLYLVLSIRAINLNRRQSNFIDSVTHELKSPIASLKLYLQTLHRRPVDQDQQARFYGFMLEDVDRLDHLINQVLDAGHLESGRVSGDVANVQLTDVVRSCAELIRLRYGVPIETFRLDLAPCVVRARRVDLDLVFRNLLDNAVKYGGTPAQVTVSVRPVPNQRAVASIADNGPGIPARLRGKIFGRFVRLGLELERKKPGTGLGLYIARTTVRRLGGRIRVRDCPGPGTVFEVELPTARAVAGSAPWPGGRYHVAPGDA